MKKNYIYIIILIFIFITNSSCTKNNNNILNLYKKKNVEIKKVQETILGFGFYQDSDVNNNDLMYLKCLLDT